MVYKGIVVCLSRKNLYHHAINPHMLVHEGNTHSYTTGSDRYCRHCNDVALAYDPSADRPRCRSCGKLV